jgi:hypothetical protein
MPISMASLKAKTACVHPASCAALASRPCDIPPRAGALWPMGGRLRLGFGPVDSYPSIAFGIELCLTPTTEGGRSTPLLNLPDRRWTYRPNWGLPGMIPPNQSGAPVLAFSRDRVLPGESVHAVIATLVPEMMDHWNLEVEPGVVLPMYEGLRVCGHGTVIWRTNITLPLDEREEQRLLSWLDDPITPLGDV